MLAAFTLAGCKDDEKDDVNKVYTVTFDVDGGAPVPSKQTVDAGDVATAPQTNPTKQGYVFMFWSLNGANTAYNFQTPITGNITLVAQWQSEATVEYWQVSLNLNGGAWAAGYMPPAQVPKGGTLAEPPEPVKTGSTFEGWYKEAALSNKVSFPFNVSVITADFTLYAAWKTTGDGGNSNGEIDANGYRIFTSVKALDAWLSAQPANTDETPYKVGLKNVNLDTDVNNGWGNLYFIEKFVKPTFVDMNLSGCTSAGIPDGWQEITYQGSNKITTTYGAFIGWKRLTAVTLPIGVKFIGKYAFSECENLGAVSLPDGLTEIREEAFCKCYKLKISLPSSLTIIGVGAFLNCYYLGSIVLPDGLKTIASQAFNNAGVSGSIVIPASVTEWGYNTFYGHELTSVVVEEGIEIIPMSAFRQDLFRSGRPLNTLESVTLPQSLKTISQEAFRDNRALTTFTIPASVVSIEGSAFHNCSSLKEVIMLPVNPPVAGYKIFESSGLVTAYAPGVIKVSAASVNAYKTAASWSEYASRIVAIE